jgi:hypothetical protein
MLSKTMIFVGMLSIAFFQGIEARTENEIEQEHVLDILKEVVVQKGHMGEGAIVNSPEYLAAREKGVAILPELADRLSSSEDEMTIRIYLLLFKYITHFHPYVYSNTTDEILGQNYYDPNTDDLPFLHRSLYEHKELRRERDDLLDWWKNIRKTISFPDHLKRMRLLIQSANGDAADFTWDTYRAFSRAFKNYGIYNVPAYVTLIKEDNNALAFLEFLKVSSHPIYQQGKMSGNPLENLQQIANVYPSHEKRVAIAIAWWESEAEKFNQLPELLSALRQAFDGR